MRQRVRLKRLTQAISEQLVNNLNQPFRRIDMLPLAGGADIGFAQAIGRDARRLGVVAEKRNSGRVGETDYCYRRLLPGEKPGLRVVS